MSEIHKELLESAKIDLNAVRVLTENNLIAPAIYYSGQVTEKASKSIFSYNLLFLENVPKENVGNELKRRYGHDLIKSTKGIINILLSLYIDYEIKLKPHLQSRKESEGKRVQSAMDNIKVEQTVKEDALFRYENLVRRLYFYFHHVMQDKSNDPSNEFRKFILILHILTIVLDGMDIKARYPLIDFNNNNIKLLMNKNNKRALNKIIEMLDELVRLVPVVWKQLDLFKATLKTK